MGTGEDVRDMTPAAYCKRQAQGDADARTDVTEGTAAGEATRVGAGSTAAIPYAEASLLTMSPRGPTWRSPALRGFIAQRPVDRSVRDLPTEDRFAVWVVGGPLCAVFGKAF